jgi:hypothetical protein
MSAWIVTPNHITQMVAGAIRLGVIDKYDAQATGRMLTRANVKSIRARYGQDDPGAKAVKTWNWYGMPARPLLSDASLCKQVRCYDYQTCEYGEYETSPARRFVKKMELALSQAGVDMDSQEYRDAPWGV